jgi:multiple sugar transport system substrate-binding protein
MGYVNDYAGKNGVKITTAAFPYNEYLNQLILQAKGGNITGAAQLDIAWLASLASLNVLKELSAYTKDAGYTQAALSSGQFNGKQYGLPWTTASIGMVGNSELLEKAGISAMPKTIQEFEAALEKLKALGPDVIPYAAMTKLAQLKDIIPWIWTFGGTVIKDGKVTLGDEGSIKAAEWYKSLLDRKLIAPDLDRAGARQLMNQGKVGFYEDAILSRDIVSKDSPVADLRKKVVPLPRPTTGTGDPQALLWGHLVVVFDKPGVEAAADFAKFLTSDANTGLDYFKKLSLPPTTDKALASDTIKTDAYISNWTDKVTKFAKLNPFLPYAASAQMETALANAVQAVITGTTPAKQAMEKAAVDIAALIK